MKKSRVTVKDVAEAANVTAQTVSRVFRNAGYVSEKTRNAVLEAAAKLDYVPNDAAILLRSGYSKNIAVVFDSLINVYFAIMIDYLHRIAQKRGYVLQTIFASRNTLDDEIYRNAISKGAIGIISFLEAEPDMGELVKKHGIPVLIFGRSTTDPLLDYISTDDKYGAALAADRLYNDGCNSFAFVVEGLGITCIDDRYEGFCSRLAEYGKQVTLIDSSDGIENVLTSLINRGIKPDGFFCSCDIIAFRTMRVIEKLGLENVKLIGYDDLQSDIELPLRITTVGIDKAEFAECAFDTFLKKVEGSYEGRIEQLIKVSLRAGSTA